MAIGLALIASVGYGVSDVISGVVVRRHTAASVALWAQVAGLVILTSLVALRRPQVTSAGVLWGAAAGVVAALGVLFFYTALQKGRTAVVVSIAGCGAVVPVVFGLAKGESAGGLTISGLAVTIIGVVVVGSGDHAEPVTALPGGPKTAPVPGRSSPMPLSDGCRPASPVLATSRTSVWLSIAAAATFGAFFVLLDTATEAATVAASGNIDTVVVVALAVQLGAFAVTLVAATRHALHCLRPTRSLVMLATTVGVLDVAADLAVTSAISIGPLTLVGPLASLEPVVSVLIATIVLRERLGLRQSVGVALVLLGTGLVAW
ncbi:EamA family transporter [Micromonospora chokoriensis]